MDGLQERDRQIAQLTEAHGAAERLALERMEELQRLDKALALVRKTADANEAEIARLNEILSTTWRIPRPRFGRR